MQLLAHRQHTFVISCDDMSRNANRAFEDFGTQDFNTDYVRHTYRGIARTVVTLPNPSFVPNINDAFFDVILSLSKV